jgi:hypothetical protein
MAVEVDVLPVHNDIVEIDEATYVAERQAKVEERKSTEGKVTTLEAENASLKTQLAQTNADLQGFMDMYFSMNP